MLYILVIQLIHNKHPPRVATKYYKRNAMTRQAIRPPIVPLRNAPGRRRLRI